MVLRDTTLVKNAPRVTERRAQPRVTTQKVAAARSEHMQTLARVVPHFKFALAKHGVNAAAGRHVKILMNVGVFKSG